MKEIIMGGICILLVVFMSGCIDSSSETPLTLTLNPNITTIHQNVTTESTEWRGNSTLVIYQSNTTLQPYTYVNQSLYWAGLNTTNTTDQFDNGDGQLHISTNWLSTFNDNWVATINTDDVSEGSGNFYDNQTWNETRGNQLYLPVNKLNLTVPINTSSVIFLVQNQTICWANASGTCVQWIKANTSGIFIWGGS